MAARSRRPRADGRAPARVPPRRREAQELIEAASSAAILYLYGKRLNLGKLRSDENALWSLGAHDISVLLRLAGEAPVEVEARGESYMHEGVEDVVFGYLRFPPASPPPAPVLAGPAQGAQLHRRRRDRMATFDDMALEGKITVYDKGFDQHRAPTASTSPAAGDIWSPRISNVEPLRTECQHFVDCIRSGETPLSDGDAGLRVVRVLEGLQQSLDATRREGPPGPSR